MKIPQIMPVTDLRKEQASVLKKMKDAPVFLTHQGRPIAVLISAEQWDQREDEIERMKRRIEELEHNK